MGLRGHSCGLLSANRQCEEVHRTAEQRAGAGIHFPSVLLGGPLDQSLNVPMSTRCGWFPISENMCGSSQKVCVWGGVGNTKETAAPFFSLV